MSRLSRTCAFGASSKATYYSLSACFLKTFDSPQAEKKTQTNEQLKQTKQIYNETQ